MYAELFQSSNFGHASALAVILLVAALPILWFTVRIERQEAQR
jgi:alpha-glucoside transport system permease protein